MLKAALVHSTGCKGHQKKTNHANDHTLNALNTTKHEKKNETVHNDQIKKKTARQQKNIPKKDSGVESPVLVYFSGEPRPPTHKATPEDFQQQVQPRQTSQHQLHKVKNRGQTPGSFAHQKKKKIQRDDDNICKTLFTPNKISLHCTILTDAFLLEDTLPPLFAPTKHNSIMEKE